MKTYEIVEDLRKQAYNESVPLGTIELCNEAADQLEWEVESRSRWHEIAVKAAWQRQVLLRALDSLCNCATLDQFTWDDARDALNKVKEEMK